MTKLEDITQSRELHLQEGSQIDLSSMAKDAGFELPVYCTQKVWDGWIVPDEEARRKGESESTRFRAVLDRLIYEIRIQRQTRHTNLLEFTVSLTRDGRSHETGFVSYLARIDSDNKNPCITLLLPEETG